MKDGSFRVATLLLTIGLWMVGSTALAASPSQAELKAKKEGKLLVLASQDASTLASLSKAFKKRCPFIDLLTGEIVNPSGVSPDIATCLGPKHRAYLISFHNLRQPATPIPVPTMDHP